MANKNPANAGFFFIPLSPPIQRTDHPQPTPIHHMQIALGGGHITVSQQLLHCADVIAVFQQVSCKGMAEGVRPTQFGCPRFCRSLLNMLANIVLMIMMAADDAGLRISGRVFGRKNKLPDFL